MKLGQCPLFDYIPHPHLDRRKAAGPPTVAAAVAQVHGPGSIGRFHAKFGLKITLIVGTMWCAYAFTVLVLASAPSAFKSGNKLIIVAWIAMTFLQLVLLPIIIVGQNVQATAADARSAAPTKMPAPSSRKRSRFSRTSRPKMRQSSGFSAPSAVSPSRPEGHRRQACGQKWPRTGWGT